MATEKQSGKLIRVPSDVHRRLKMEAAKVGKTITAIIADWVRGWKGGAK